MSYSSSTSKSISIIIDDLRGDAFSLSGGGSWTVKKADQWFNGTTQLLESATDSTDPKQLGTIRMTFNGTSVALFGTTPPSSSSQTMSVSIDGSTSSNTSYSDPNPQTYRQWYQSPVLSDGPHTLTLGNIAGTALDFAVVTVGENTPLNAQTVIVDNGDPAVVYSKKKGKWSENTSAFNSGPNPDGFGYGNSTHDTTYEGSSFSYKFSAVSIGVYGVFSWSQVGSLSVEFSIDGNPQKKDFTVTTDTPQFKSELGQQQNFLFHSFDFLSPGVHTLTVNVTDCQNQAFSFDYLTYAPNFATLSTMPDVGIAASDDDAVPTSGDGDSGNTFSKRVIIGAVIAAVALLLLIGGLAFFLRRRKRRNWGAGRMGKVDSKAKYSPRDVLVEAVPFATRPSAQVQVNAIPLSQQLSPPPSNPTPYYDTSAAPFTTNPSPGMLSTSNSTAALGPMARLQEASAVQYGLQLPNAHQNQYVSDQKRGTGALEDDPFNRGSRPGTSSGSQQEHASNGQGEPSPPSYDDVTGGQAPTHVTYVIPR